MGAFDVLLDDERTQLDAFVEDYRRALGATVDRLTEEQARRHLVPSATTLLGLLKHVTWMQRVWFEECVGGTSRRELGMVQSPDDSFQLTDDDTPSPPSPQPTGMPARRPTRRSPTCRWTPS